MDRMVLMQRALALAVRGRGAVEPNPMVGALILDTNGEVVGEGWHQRYGGPHAEVHALAAAGDAAKGGTLVVTLEPCCHHGKTPPCTEAILQAGIQQVIVAMTDPFPHVAGGGIAALRAAGVSVEVGVHGAEAVALNRPYLKLITQQQPWVIGKWAMSLDGRIATKTGHSQWISSSASRAMVHDLRGRVDAILVGAGTVHADDPMLTARPPGPRTAARVVVSASGALPTNCQLLASLDHAPVLVFTTPHGAERLRGWVQAGVEVLARDELTVPHLLSELGQRRMTNILVEGGGGLLGSFHDANALDELWVYIAPIVLGGTQAKAPIAGTGVATIGDATRFTVIQQQGSDGDLFVKLRHTRYTGTRTQTTDGAAS